MKAILIKVLTIAAIILALLVLPPYWRGFLVGILVCRAYYLMRAELEKNLEAWLKKYEEG